MVILSMLSLYFDWILVNITDIIIHINLKVSVCIEQSQLSVCYCEYLTFLECYNTIE